jgi:Fe-Mn family superoxide dismutase
MKEFKGALMSFTLPDLPYAYDALEPYIDAETMRIHHTKHHQAYVDKLNAALETEPTFADWSIEQLLTNLEQLPENIQMAVRNNGGGHRNHSMFWTMMRPGQEKNTPSGILLQRMVEQFGSFEAFKERFAAEALSRFGSGWIWLLYQPGDHFQIVSTPNQDVPMMDDAQPKLILGLDVWEHAYYLKYQNRRPDYVQAWWNVVNWDEVLKRME